MTSSSEARASLRPTTATASFGCMKCVFFPICGGLEADAGHYDCFDLCKGNCSSCDNVCPRSSRFTHWLQEVRGLRFDNLKGIEQHEASLPLYVPKLQHRYSRCMPLDWPVVAISTYELFHRNRQGHYTTAATSGAQLRRDFVLAAKTRIILTGVARDKHLERYWAHRRRDSAPQQLADLGIDLVIGPNFSHFLDVPRTDNLFNRKRQLICLEELSEAGLSPVPNLSAVRPRDWAFWSKYLAQNPTITVVAAEFQTGNKKKAEAVRVLKHIAQIQHDIGRALHMILIAGGRFLEEACSRFADITVIDSRPFMASAKRQGLRFSDAKARCFPSPTPVGAPIDDLFFLNLAGYSRWIDGRARRSRQNTSPPTRSGGRAFGRPSQIRSSVA